MFHNRSIASNCCYHSVSSFPLLIFSLTVLMSCPLEHVYISPVYQEGVKSLLGVFHENHVVLFSSFLLIFSSITSSFLAIFARNFHYKVTFPPLRAGLQTQHHDNYFCLFLSEGWRYLNKESCADISSLYTTQIYYIITYYAAENGSLYWWCDVIK